MDKEIAQSWAKYIQIRKKYYSDKVDIDNDDSKRVYKCFVDDGIVCDDKWNNPNNPHILVVLREPRAQIENYCRIEDACHIEGGIFSLAQYLDKKDDQGKCVWKSSSTYRPLADWIKTIFAHNKYSTEEQDNIFTHVAVINLKKTPGGSSCNRNKLKDFCSDEKNKMFLREQLDKINPNIIILSNEWANFCTIMGVDPRPTPYVVERDKIKPLNVYECKLPMPRGKALVFDAYHPSARGKYRTLAVDFTKYYKR